MSREAGWTAGGLLILGCTGLLGQALMAEAQSRGWPCSGLARSGADHEVDVSETAALEALLRELSPSAIVNCIAITNHQTCEEDPALAYLLNSRTPALLASISAELGVRFVQISSDHYFTGDGSSAHSESADVTLLNEYARSKYAGEQLALTNPAALVVRTNIVGMRRWPQRPTFAEWAISAIENGEPMTLFDDFFTSSMHVRACSAAVLDLLDIDATGLINVASSEVSSKQRFVRALARALDVELDDVGVGSVRALTPVRAESLGLDVTRAENLLGRRLPDLAATIAAIVHERNNPALHDLQH
jgi:dTDP-4-dehydrorhamnose reductase